MSGPGFVAAVLALVGAMAQPVAPGEAESLLECFAWHDGIYYQTECCIEDVCVRMDVYEEKAKEGYAI